MQKLMSGKKKGNLDMIQTAVFSIMMIGVFVGLGVLFLTGMDDATTNTQASEALNDTTTAIVGFIDWLPLIVTVVVIVVLMFLMIMIQRYRNKAGA